MISAWERFIEPTRLSIAPSSLCSARRSFFFIFLIIVTLFIVDYKSSVVFSAKTQQHMYWSECDATGNCKLEKVSSHEDLLDWMRDSIVPKAFIYKDNYPAWNSEIDHDADLNENAIPWNPRYVSDTQTVALLGNIRIRQLRVKPNGLITKGGCEVNERLWKSGEFECYPQYSTARESKVKYADTWTPNKELYTHKTAAETNQIPMTGHFGRYDASGYFFDLPLSKREALERIEALREWNWMDVATRAVIIEFSVVNPHVNVIINHRLLFEFGPTGSKASHDVFPLRVGTLSLSLLETDLRTLFMLQIASTAFFILYFAYVIFIFVQNGMAFFFYLWNIVDVAICVFAILFMKEQGSVYSVFTSEPDFQSPTLGQPEVFPPFSKLIEPVQECNNWLAFVALFVWLRCLKYFTLVQSFRLLVRVLEKTVWDLFVFLTLLMTIFCGFSIAFHVGFGHLAAFSSLYTSFFSLFFMLASSTQISGLFEANWLGEALYISYLILVYFLLFNMFMAVVIDTYSIATMLKRNFQSTDSPFACFFVAYVNKIVGISLVGQENPEEIGFPHEQFIQTRMLPLPVAEMWKKKRDDLQKICESSGFKVEARDDVVSRVQLQRLMDENQNLKEWLDEEKAIDVIRKFQVQEISDSYEEVTRLQTAVFDKLKSLEGAGMKLNFTDLESLKMVSQGLHNALSDIQNLWRIELTEVLEVIQALSDQLLQITSKLERVQVNHTKISVDVTNQEQAKRFGEQQAIGNG